MSSPPSHRSCSHALCSHSPCLTDLGWDSDWASALAASAPAGEPGRVARVDLGFCTVLTAAGAQRASAARGAPLAVGDWVALIPCTGSSGWSLTLLPRRTALVRRSAGQDPHPQVLAANVDTVLVVVALGGRISPRLIDRYVALAWQSGVSRSGRRERGSPPSSTASRAQTWPRARSAPTAVEGTRRPTGSLSLCRPAGCSWTPRAFVR